MEEPRGTGVRDLVIDQVDYGHPDAVRLVAMVQQEYVERYGAPDEGPVDPAEFVAPAGGFYIGYAGGVALASGAWRHSGVDRLGTTGTAEIKRLYVVPEAQRRGHARRMLAHLEGVTRDAGFEAVVLETGVHQPEAIALYLSAGYQEIPRFGHYADDELSRCFGRLLS